MTIKKSKDELLQMMYKLEKANKELKKRINLYSCTGNNIDVIVDQNNANKGKTTWVISKFLKLIKD